MTQSPPAVDTATAALLALMAQMAELERELQRERAKLDAQTSR